MKKAVILSLIAGFALIGCSKKEEEAQKAAEQMQKAMEQMGQTPQGQAGAAAKAPGVAIPAKKLITFLPDISGFTRDKEPEYMDMEMQGTKYSHASQRYIAGDKDIKISIFDYNYITGLAGMYSALLTMNMETNEELMRSEKFGGYPGWFDWHKNNNEGSVGVVVSDRVFVVIEGGKGVTDAELHSAANAVNYSGIAGEVK
jgi:hypothetical protein